MVQAFEERYGILTGQTGIGCQQPALLHVYAHQSPAAVLGQFRRGLLDKGEGCGLRSQNGRDFGREAVQIGQPGDAYIGHCLCHSGDLADRLQVIPLSGDQV